MKKVTVSLVLLFLAALGLPADTLDDLVSQARGKYAQGQTKEALSLLGVALATSPISAAEKQTLGGAYTDIGVREYDRRNFKNAYDCFRNAVKLAPTNQVASKYFWQMKREMNVESLKNEAEETAKATPPSQGAPAEGGTSQPGAETAAYRETVEKLAKTEQELANLRNNASLSRDEYAAMRAELERQKASAEREREELRRMALTARDQSSTLQSELDRTRNQIDQLRERVQRTGQPTVAENKALSELLALYRQNLEQQDSAEKEGNRYLADQLAEQRQLLELQYRAFSGRNLFLLGAFALLAVLVVFLLLLIVRAQLRRKRERRAGEALAVYPSMALAAEAGQEARSRIGGSQSLLLEFSGEEGRSSGTEPAPAESGMYRDLLKAERIRRMHDQMKQGNLKWETVRDYLGELEMDLRVEILKVVESRLQVGDGLDPRAVLQVLSPYLSEYDDYLREKAESLVRTALAAVPRAQALLPEPAGGALREVDGSPLGTPKLLEVGEKLKKLLKDRERSAATAKVARGIARSLNLSPADSDLLYKAALAHDAGYLLLDQDRLRRILGKPILSEEEFRFIQSHARKGPEYFKGTRLPPAFREALLCHHERNDGSGYPKGLTGPKIPLFAKIIGVAETFVALTSARPYREKLSAESALAVIRDGSGRKFDREHVNALTDLVRSAGEGL
jgi:HD-GYP domain-containing protein (c-di-GMP phosphodiesterase class II)